MFFNVGKTKRIAKFDSLEPRRCEDIKGIVAPEIGSKSFGTFEKQATDPRSSKGGQAIQCRYITINRTTRFDSARQLDGDFIH